MKKKSNCNQIYICYRHNSGLYMAKEIADFLKRKGYKIFMGDINSTYLEICKMIELCDDFIIILNEKALDNCIEPNDRIKQEILYAQKLNKNIILAQDQIKFIQYPILPSELEFLKYLNWTAINPQLFNASMEILTQRLKAISKHHTILKNILWGISFLILCFIIISIYIFLPISLKEVGDEYDDIIISVPEKWTDLTDQVDLSESLGGEQLLFYSGKEGGIMVIEMEDSLNTFSSIPEQTLIEQIKVNIASKGGKFLKSSTRNIYGKKILVSKYVHSTYIYETFNIKSDLDSETYYYIVFYYSEELNILKKYRLSNNLNRIIESIQILE